MTAPPLVQPYLLPDGTPLQPFTWGVSHGSGFLGSQIRQAEQRMTVKDAYPQGDHVAAWAGHAFRYVGYRHLAVNEPPVPCIVEAEWPKVKLSPVTAHRDALWATGEPYTDEERHLGLAATLGMLGMHYDPFVYPWFVAKALGLAVSGDLGPMFRDPRWMICSGVVAAGERRAGVGPALLMALRFSDNDDPNVISPAGLLRWGLNAGSTAPDPGRPLGWMHQAVPSWQ
jgi:hypothetical protein